MEYHINWMVQPTNGIFNLQETRSITYMDIIEWNTFHDGFPNLFIKNVKEIAGKDSKIKLLHYDIRLISML